MKILEAWGIDKVNFFYQRFSNSRTKHQSIHGLFKSKILYLPITLAFIIGFIFTLPIIFFELILNLYQEPTLFNVTLYLMVTLISVFLEFYFLFLLSFITLAYYIHHLYQIDSDIYDITQEEFVSTLVRTVMELPEKKIIKYNLNPYEYKEHKIVLLSLVYKAKVMLSNIVAKFIVKKALTRSSLRVYSAYIAAPITGIWDSMIFYKTIRESQYKIMVRFIVLHLIQTKMKIFQKEENIQLVLFRYYYFGEYHNSLDQLLQNIYQVKAFEYSKESYLEVGLSNLKLLSLLFAFKNGLFSSKEKTIILENKIYENVKIIRKNIRNSDMQYLKNYISQM